MAPGNGVPYKCSKGFYKNPSDMGRPPGRSVIAVQTVTKSDRRKTAEVIDWREPAAGARKTEKLFALCFPAALSQLLD